MLKSAATSLPALALQQTMSVSCHIADCSNAICHIKQCTFWPAYTDSNVDSTTRPASPLMSPAFAESDVSVIGLFSKKPAPCSVQCTHHED
jgi:hypothetical protein